MAERLFWGEGGEYGPYHAQEDGWPHAGEVMRDYRLRMGVSTEEAARRYSEALQQISQKKGKQDRSIAASWISMMEKENRVPTDIMRRRLLADLFHIPYALFGLASLEQVVLRPKAEQQIQQRAVPTILHHASVNIERYEQENRLLWQLHETSTAHTSLYEVDTAIQSLKMIGSEARGQLKKHELLLLSSYYHLGSVIARDQRAFTKSYSYANAAVQVAASVGNESMIATAQYRRGFTNLIWGLFGEVDQTGTFKLSYGKITAAITDFEQALPHAQSQLKGFIWLELSRAYGYLKQSPMDIIIALKLIDQAENMIGSEAQEDLYASTPVKSFSEGRYYLGRAVALTTSGKPEKAIDTLDLLEDLRDVNGIGRSELRRHAWIDIQYAQACIGMKEYYEATRRATNALLVCKDINSASNIAIIHALYSQIPKQFSKGNSEVVELGSMLADYYGLKKDHS